MIYHGVMDTCNGFVYSMGAALLDLDEPWRVLYRTNQHLLTPEADYEVSGHVPNVVFPCAALHDKAAESPGHLLWRRRHFVLPGLCTFERADRVRERKLRGVLRLSFSMFGRVPGYRN